MCIDLNLISKKLFIKILLFLFASLNSAAPLGAQTNSATGSRPNVIYILADDLGIGDIEPFGQRHIKTPNLNRMMNEGMLLLQHYAGNTVCAPSRASLITSTVDEATRPIVTSFEEALSEREGVLRLFSYLSPAVGVHGSFNEIAGTSSRRHQSYLRQARNFKASYAGLVGPDVVAKRPVSSEVFESVSPFEFIEDTMLERLNRSISPIIFFLLLSIGMLVVTNRRLKSINPIS